MGWSYEIKDCEGKNYTYCGNKVNKGILLLGIVTCYFHFICFLRFDNKYNNEEGEFRLHAFNQEIVDLKIDEFIKEHYPKELMMESLKYDRKPYW